MQASDVESPLEANLHGGGSESREQSDAVAERDAAAFAVAIDAHTQRTLGVAFAHRCLTVALWLGCGLILSICLNGYLGWKVANPPIKYFATQNGRIIEVHPTDQPHYSQTDVGKYGADTIRDSFTLDFVHYRDQMTKAGERYSELGYQDYYNALVTSNLYTAVKDQRLNLSVEVGPGVIRSKGRPGGVFTWEFQYPVTMKLDGQNTSSPVQRFIFTQRVQRVEENVKEAGLEVTQVITTKAN